MILGKTWKFFKGGPKPLEIGLRKYSLLALIKVESFQIWKMSFKISVDSKTSNILYSEVI